MDSSVRAAAAILSLRTILSATLAESCYVDFTHKQFDLDLGEEPRFSKGARQLVCPGTFEVADAMLRRFVSLVLLGRFGVETYALELAAPCSVHAFILYWMIVSVLYS